MRGKYVSYEKRRRCPMRYAHLKFKTVERKAIFKKESDSAFLYGIEEISCLFTFVVKKRK